MQYIKIKELIIDQIESGLLTSNERLPSERKLAESFSTTRITLREALSSLEADGKIYSEDRRGWYISPEVFKYDIHSIECFSEMARNQGRKSEVKFLLAEEALASKEIATLLNLSAFSLVYRIEKVGYLEDRPVVYSIQLIEAKDFPKLLSFDLSKNSLVDIYQKYFSMDYKLTNYKISTTSLTNKAAKILRAAPGSLSLMLKRVNYSQKGAIIDGEIMFWRHDAINIISKMA